MNKPVIQDKTVELALQTLEQFTTKAQKSSLFSLDLFEFSDGKLLSKKKSPLQKTVTFFIQAFSREKRIQQRRMHNSVKRVLLKSVETIKIALMKNHLSNRSCDADKERLIQVASHYNACIIGSQNPPRGLFAKARYYVLRALGYFLDDDVQKSIIFIPKKRLMHHHESPRCEPVTIGTIIMPSAVQKQAIELFHAKARTLLHTNTPESVVHELIKTLRSTPVEMVATSDSIISLQQKFSCLPGEVLELKGDFTRTEKITIPIKESFHLRTNASQTGYPDATQSTGLIFSCECLPKYILKPYSAPKFAQLLAKKEEIAEKLLPDGAYNKKAKELLRIRKQLFISQKAVLFPLLQRLILLLFAQSSHPQPLLRPFIEKLEQQKEYFPLYCALHSDAIEKYLAAPIREREQHWLSGILTEAHFHAPATSSITASYDAAVAHLLAPCVGPISRFLFTGAPLTAPLPQKIIVSSILDLENFITELETLPTTEAAMLPWLINCLSKKITLLAPSATASHPILEELSAGD